MIIQSQTGLAPGYLSPAFAASQAEFGQPLHLPCSNAWILRRQIPGFSEPDAMGLYPLFACMDWWRLNEDFETLRDDLICLSVVTDPFGDYTETGLQTCFEDVVKPYKAHYVTDLTCSPNEFVVPHHRRNVRKSRENIVVDQPENSPELLDDWVGLYAQLIKKHNITGIRTFSRNSFAGQLQVPGLVVFRARHQSVTVGMMLWYVQNDVAYYHLGAYSELGYRFFASFALVWQAIEYFASNGLRWLNLGAGAGLASDGGDGLSRFKKGWSTETRMAYFCGKIFDREKYHKIVKAAQTTASGYFPAYRSGEFV